MHPRLFIGSSVEGLDIGYAAQENLDRDAEVTVWPQGIFSPSRTTLQDLLDACRQFDFSLFVLHPDDVLTIRGRRKQAVRDNVIFELGMFISALGAERCFILAPLGSDNLRIPTDLLGLNLVTFDAGRQDANLPAALGPACNQLRRAIRRLGLRHPPAERRRASPNERKPLSPFEAVLSKLPGESLAFVREISDNHLTEIQYQEALTRPVLGDAVRALRSVRILVPLVGYGGRGRKETVYWFPPDDSDAIRKAAASLPDPAEEAEDAIEEGLEEIGYSLRH